MIIKLYVFKLLILTIVKFIYLLTIVINYIIDAVIYNRKMC